MKSLLLILLWFPTTILTLLFTLGYYSYHQDYKNNLINNNSPDKLKNIPYQFYTSLPKVLGAKTINAFHIESEDIIPELIYNYIKRHGSPMLTTSQDLIDAARKYEIDPLFMVAIAQCESNLGKKMPPSCNNPFGWGIHSKGTLCFETWQEGYNTVAEGLRKKYYDKGFQSTEEIMAKYTPPALEKGGSWAKCVNQFVEELNEIKTGI